MKKHAIFFVMIFIIVTNSLNAQHHDCHCAATSATVSPTPPPANLCGNFLSNFVPKPSDPNDTIDLNFIFFKPPSSVGIYTPSIITPTIIQTMVNNCLINET